MDHVWVVWDYSGEGGGSNALAIFGEEVEALRFAVADPGIGRRVSQWQLGTEFAPDVGP